MLSSPPAIRNRISSGDAAQLLGLSRQTVVKLAANGQLPAAKVGALWTFDPETIAKIKDGEPLRPRRISEAAPPVDPEWLASKRARPYERVYVVGFGRYVKIGYSAARKSSRIRGLQTGAPEKLTIHGIIDGGRELELLLHRRFAVYRLSGEWFRKRGKLAEWIKDGCAPPTKYRETKRHKNGHNHDGSGFLSI